MVEKTNLSLCRGVSSAFQTAGGFILFYNPDTRIIKELNFNKKKPGNQSPTVIMFFDDHANAVKFKRKLKNKPLPFKYSTVVGDISFFPPIVKRKLSCFIFSMEKTAKQEKERFIRMVCSLLKQDGILIGRFASTDRLIEKIFNLVIIPIRLLTIGSRKIWTEAEVTSALLRGGFNRIEKHKSSALKTSTFYLARKNAL